MIPFGLGESGPYQVMLPAWMFRDMYVVPTCTAVSNDDDWWSRLKMMLLTGMRQIDKFGGLMTMHTMGGRQQQRRRERWWQRLQRRLWRGRWWVVGSMVETGEVGPMRCLEEREEFLRHLESS